MSTSLTRHWCSCFSLSAIAVLATRPFRSQSRDDRLRAVGRGDDGRRLLTRAKAHIDRCRTRPTAVKSRPCRRPTHGRPGKQKGKRRNEWTTSRSASTTRSPVARGRLGEGRGGNDESRSRNRTRFEVHTSHGGHSSLGNRSNAQRGHVWTLPPGRRRVAAAAAATEDGDKTDDGRSWTPKQLLLITAVRPTPARGATIPFHFIVIRANESNNNFKNQQKRFSFVNVKKTLLLWFFHFRLLLRK